MSPIHEVFNQPGAGFTLMRDGIKFPPIEKGWQKPEKAHSFQEATVHRGNVGTLAGIGPYGGLDLDEPEAFEGLTLPEHTTKWETRPGRFGMRFIWNDRTPELLVKYGISKKDQAQIKLFDSSRIVNGYHPAVGEVKLERSYQVIPPSWKTLDDGSRADYKLLDSTPPAEISLDQLLSDLLKIGIVFSKIPKKKESRLETNIKKLKAIPQDAANEQKDRTEKAKELLNDAVKEGQQAKGSDKKKIADALACQLKDLGLTITEVSAFLTTYAGHMPAEDYDGIGAIYSTKQAFSTAAPSQTPNQAPRQISKADREKAEAKAEEFLNRALLEGLTPHCRNDTGFGLACQLRDLGLTKEQAAVFLSQYAAGVPAGDHPYTEADALESLGQAYSLEPRDPPKSEERRRHEETIKALPEMVKADPRSIKNDGVIEALAALCIHDPIEYDLALEAIRKNAKGIKKSTIEKMVADHIEATKTAPNTPERCPCPEVSEDITTAARGILENGDPLTEHQNYITEKVCGGEKPARAITLSGYSAYVEGDRLHADVVGGAQSGKSTTTITALECFPDENVLIASEASPKSLYYLAQQQPERLKDAIIYIDDARPEHIPVLKTFRNESSVQPTNITVADGEFLELIVQYRPVVIASSVTPLRDHEGQATSRALLVSVPDATEEEEKKVREKIRQQIATGAILSQKTDDKRLILQQMVRILRDEGVRNVAIPFDIREPKGADRRGTGQFMRLIKVLAFINQFQRPIIEMQDGRRVALATYADFLTAAKIWFDFAEGQEFKISPKAVTILNALPDRVCAPGTLLEMWQGKTAPTIAKELGRGQRSTERYLEDLYEAGIASREKITAPGMPYGYWIEPETRQKVLSQIPEAEEGTTNSVRIATTKFCREYVAENQPDSLKDSYIKFFSNSDIDIKKMYYGGKEVILSATAGREGFSSLYTPLFSGKSCRDSENGPTDSEIITTGDLSLLSESPADSDLGLSQIGGEIVAIPPGEDTQPVLGKIDRPTPTAPPPEQGPAGKGDTPKLRCAKCGADLTGHGTVETGGKLYCARTGCGYPARAEART